MASVGNVAGTSEQGPTYDGFHLNPYPVVATPRSRSPSLSMASSNDPPEVPSGPRRWDEDIVHLLGDLEGSKLFRKHLERHQLGHYHKFYHFCNNFKKRVEESAPTVTLRKMIRLAYENYIKAGKQLFVQCLDSDVRAAIAEKMAEDTIDITIFDAAQKQVLESLRQTSYGSFFESDAYLKSDIYLDFVDYVQHQNSAEMRRRERKAAPVKNKEEFQKNREVAQHRDHVARNECARFFSEVEMALTKGDSKEVASPVKNAAIIGARHPRSQNHDQDKEKVQDTLMRQGNPPKDMKEQGESKITTKCSSTKENVEETVHNRHQPSSLIPSRMSVPKEREDLKGWDFGQKMSTGMILEKPKYQSNTFKQHQSAKSHDQECSDQSILDDHCSKVFDNSPSPPRDRKKGKTRDSTSLGLGCGKFQAGHKMPSWQGEFEIYIFAQNRNQGMRACTLLFQSTPQRRRRPMLMPSGTQVPSPASA